jgi:hypothetical protein
MSVGDYAVASVTFPELLALLLPANHTFFYLKLLCQSNGLSDLGIFSICPY